MRSVVSILLAFASVALAETNYIEGQVFVVTAAHESVKLGLVVVAACRADEFADAVSATKSKIDSERAKLDTMRPVADAMAATAAQLHDAVTRAPEPTLSTLLGESIRLEVDTAMLVQRVRWRSDYLDCAAPYFKNLPHPIASAKTDADGKFKMELPASTGQTVVVASATGLLPGALENYYWTVKITPPATVTLSNDNLTSAGSNDSALQTVWLTGAPNEDTADTLKAELQKLRTDVQKINHDFLVSTGKAEHYSR